MSPIGDRNNGWNGARDNIAARRLALQKLKPASDLAQGLGDDAPRNEPSFENRAQGTLHRSGTGSAVPFRYDHRSDAPRLTSAFVAQLLGQVLPDPGTRGSEARTTYGSSDSVTSLLLDTQA